MNRHDKALLKKLKDTVAKQGKDSIPIETLNNLLQNKCLEVQQWVLNTYPQSTFTNADKNIKDRMASHFYNNPNLMNLISNNEIKFEIAKKKITRCRDYNELFSQEGIYNIAELQNKKLSEFVEFHKKFHSRKEFAPKIPLIRHIVYPFENETSKISEYHIDRILKSSKQLIKTGLSWKTFFWTNHENRVPSEILAIPNIKIKNFSLLDKYPVYQNALNLFEESLTKEYYKSIMAKISDIFRLLVVLEDGGCYFDCDYLIANGNELVKYLSVGLILGTEDWPGQDEKYIGNAFFGATPHHEALEIASNLMYRNLEKNTPIPDCIRYPYSSFSQIITETGPLLIMVSYYKFLNTNKTDDSILIPGKISYNMNWSRSQISLNQPCTYDKTVDECYNFDGQEVCIIGGDPFCGVWAHTQPGFYDRLPTEIMGIQLENGTFIPFEVN